jgi:hypothetical protein
LNNTRVGLADAVEGISHDALNRLLQGSTPLLAMLQRLVIKLVQKGGYLILDDTTLQKFTTGLGCIFKVKDSKTGGLILGIQGVLLLWTNGTLSVPVGFHLYRGKEKHGKHDLALQLLRKAQRLGLQPEYVVFDSWYARARLLKYIREQGWQFVTRLKKNRSLNGKQLRCFRRGPYRSALGYLRGLSPGEQVLCQQRPGVGLADPAKPVQNPLHHRGDLPGLEAGMRLGGGTAAIHPRLPPSSHPWAAGLHLSRSTIYLDQLKSHRKTTPYKLRRQLISGKLKVSELELQRFLEAA